jgi:hypothetical protein
MIIKGRPIFDIIAGTSIGAINAAFLVSYVVENQTCEGVHYDKVITSDHVIASGSFPVNLEPSMPILLLYSSLVRSWAKFSCLTKAIPI